MSLNLDRSGWERVKFGDVVRQVKDTTDPVVDGVKRYVAGEHMDSDNLSISRWGLVGDGYLGPAFHRKFKAGQVLYGSRRTYLRKVALAEFDGVCANTTFVMESADPSRLLPELLPFVMSTEAFHAHSIAESKGSVNPYVNWPDIAKYEFDLPPLDQQRRLAALLWGSTRLLASYEHLEVRLREVRDAVVDRHASSVPSRPFSELVHRLSDGPFGSKIKSEHYSETAGVRVLRLQDVGEGSTRDHDIAWLDTEHVQENLSAYRVAANDVLIAGLGDEKHPVGRAALAASVEGAVHKADVFRAVVREDIVSAPYVVAVVNSRLVRRGVNSRAQGTTRLRINTSNMKKVLVPCAKADEQLALLHTLAEIDASIAAAASALASTRALREALLGEVAS